MEYQNIINLLHNTTNKPAKLGTRNQVEVNNESTAGAPLNNTNKKVIFKKPAHLLVT